MLCAQQDWISLQNNTNANCTNSCYTQYCTVQYSPYLPFIYSWYNLHTKQLNTHIIEVNFSQSRKAMYVQVLGWIERLSQSCPPPASPSRLTSSGAKRMVRGYLCLAPCLSWTTTSIWAALTEETKSGATTAAERNAGNFTNTSFIFCLTWLSQMPSSYKRAIVRMHLSAQSRNLNSSWQVSS